MFESWLLGVHLLTWHSAGCWEGPSGCHSYNKATVGVYAREAGGLTVGAYRNSYGEPSAYAGWTWETRDRRFSLLVAGVTGYRRAPVTILVAPSLRVPLIQSSAFRLALIPDTKQVVLHLGLETRF